MSDEATRLPHLDARGAAHMVDVGDKPVTQRRAEARAVVEANARAIEAIGRGDGAKGDALAVARIAGISAAKLTGQLIPLCHPLPLTRVAVDIVVGDTSIELRVVAECTGPTGVEMEAMTGVSVAALALYDMIKGLDRRARIACVELVSKSGGRSGDFVR